MKSIEKKPSLFCISMNVHTPKKAGSCTPQDGNATRNRHTGPFDAVRQRKRQNEPLGQNAHAQHWTIDKIQSIFCTTWLAMLFHSDQKKSQKEKNRIFFSFFVFVAKDLLCVRLWKNGKKRIKPSNKTL